jgi:hypothetical protein
MQENSSHLPLPQPAGISTGIADTLGRCWSRAGMSVIAY